MIVRTYGRRSSSNSRSSNTNSFNFDDTDGFNDSSSQRSPHELETSNADIFNFPFTSIESTKNPYSFDSFDSDPYSFDLSEDSHKLTVVPPRSKKLKTELNEKRKDKKDKKGKKEKKPLMMVTETATLMETQEFGEMMEHVDEVDFALDGLRKGQPVRIRRASLLSLLMVCGSLQQRRLVRTHGMAKTIIDAVLDLNLDDTPSNLAAAVLFFVLTSDGQEDYLLDSPSAIRFLLKLLKPATTNVTMNKVSTLGSKLVALRKDAPFYNDGKGDESASVSILQKVEEILLICKELKPRVESGMIRPELNPKWVALLTMEKACLSTVALEETTGTVRKMGGNFKERLRERGGLDAVIDIIRECHGVMEGWLERYSSPSPSPESRNIVNLESPILLLKCLKIMENATFLSSDNQNHLLGMEDDDEFDYRHVSQSFTKLILGVIKILSGVSLIKKSSFTSDIRNGDNWTVHISDLPLLADDKAINSNEIIDISSSIEICSMDQVPSQKTSNISQKNQILSQKQPVSSKSDPVSGFSSHLLKTKSKASTSGSNSGSIIDGKKSGASQHAMFDFEKRQDPFCLEDPFAFDEAEEEPNKWALLLSSRKSVSHSQKSSSTVEKDIEQKFDLAMSSQQDSSNAELIDLPHASCFCVDNDESFNLFADCLLSAVKVLMNLTNENPVGCQQIAACGGLETLCGLIVGHYPSFNSYLPNFSDQKDKLVLEADKNNNQRLNDQELDFLVAILGLLVNLVEKDGHNRSRLATASISIPSLEHEISDVIPLLCSIFLANQGAGEAAEGRHSTWNDVDPVLEGEKEAEKTIVEAYSALLLAFLSTESKSIRNAIAECLPKHKLSVLVPVLEKFVEFHMSLNMISEETHSMVLEVVESCRMH
ncbi:hypothetical protein R6Q57_013585 [Mikania cordata]